MKLKTLKQKNFVQEYSLLVNRSAILKIGKKAFKMVRLNIKRSILKFKTLFKRL